MVGNESTKSAIISGPTENAPIPPLLITEVVPDTDNYAKYDAFEYIEIYNNSSEAIDLKGYSIKSGSWIKEITEPLLIQPWDTQLFWTGRQEIAPITLEAFNNRYFASYHDKYLDEKRYMYLITSAA
ncbi:lamin tail domain-containing protein [Bacillus sp. N9]